MSVRVCRLSQLRQLRLTTSTTYCSAPSDVGFRVWFASRNVFPAETAVAAVVLRAISVVECHSPIPRA